MAGNSAPFCARATSRSGVAAIILMRGLGPLVSLDEDFAIDGHAWLGIPKASFQLQLDADDLLDAVALEVGVFRREGLLGIDPGDISIDGLLWIGVEERARGLAELD